MRKIMMLMVAALALGFAASAGAVEISNLNGQSCGDGTGTWHFINNGLEVGGPEGSLLATFSSGDSCDVSPSKINRRNQHFLCVGSGELLSAETDLGGRLVLSDFTCEAKCDKNCPPPSK